MVARPASKDTSQSPMPITFDRDAARVIDRGRAAWRDQRRDESWEKWVAIGRAIDIARTTIMRHLGTNLPKGRTWSTVFGRWLLENEFDQIDKAARSRLQTCIGNLPAIEARRATLPLKRRLELNHPNAVLRHWRSASEKPRDRKNTIRDLFEGDHTADKITHSIAPVDFSPEHIAASAHNFVEIFGAEDTQRFVTALQTILAEPDPASAAPITETVTSANEKNAEISETETEIIALATAHPHWTPRGIARACSLRASENAVVQTLRNAGIRLQHKGKAWGGSSRTALRQAARH